MLLHEGKSVGNDFSHSAVVRNEHDSSRYRGGNEMFPSADAQMLECRLRKDHSAGIANGADAKSCSLVRDID